MTSHSQSRSPLSGERCAATFRRSRTLTVMVPALNERENLGPTVERLLKALSTTVEDFEIIIVNDGSSDGTGEIAEALAAGHEKVRALHNPRPTGLGYAYQRGIDAAEMSFFVYIPGDNTWPCRSLFELFGNLGKADVVTSYATNPNVRTFGRRIVSAGYTKTINFLFRRRMKYFNGLTIYPTAFLKKNTLSTRGFGFQAEILVTALDGGLSVVECALPIDERSAGGSKAVTLKNIFSVMVTVARMFWRLRVRPVVARGKPDAIGYDRQDWGVAGSSSVAEMGPSMRPHETDRDESESGSPAEPGRSAAPIPDSEAGKETATKGDHESANSCDVRHPALFAVDYRSLSPPESAASRGGDDAAVSDFAAGVRGRCDVYPG